MGKVYNIAPPAVNKLNYLKILIIYRYIVNNTYIRIVIKRGIGKTLPILI
jgi:hypothetical protein